VGQAIGQFLPLAIGVALSPVPIIVVIAMLFSPHAKSNGPAYLLGWLIAVGMVAGISLAASDVASVGSEEAATNGASWVKLALGVLLLYGALRQWRKLGRRGSSCRFRLITFAAKFDGRNVVLA